MSEIWNPFKEKAEAIKSVVAFFEKNIKYFITLIVVFVVCYFVRDMYKSYIYRAYSTIPCEDVKKLLKKE